MKHGSPERKTTRHSYHITHPVNTEGRRRGRCLSLFPLLFLLSEGLSLCLFLEPLAQLKRSSYIQTQNETQHHWITSRKFLVHSPSSYWFLNSAHFELTAPFALLSRTSGEILLFVLVEHSLSALTSASINSARWTKHSQTLKGSHY